MPDLMIGTRRSGTQRPWRAAAIGLGLLCAAGVVAWFIFERSVTYEIPAGEVDGGVAWNSDAAGGSALTFRSARLSWRGGVAVLHLPGGGLDRGAAHGRLLGAQMLHAVASAQPSLDAMASARGAWARWTHALRVDWRLRFLDDGLSDSDRGLLAGMLRGAELGAHDYQALVRAQAVWDIGLPAAGSDGTGLVRSLSVLALQEAQGAGRVWLGHAWSAPGLVDGGEALAPVVTFAKPTSGLRWASVGWPGSAGVAVGINEKGLALLVNPARTRDVRATRAARPVLLLARSVLEQSASLDEAVRTLENTATLGAASYLVVDGRGGKWAVVERSPSRAVVTRASGPLALGDSLAAAAFAADPLNERVRRLAPTAPRTGRAAQLVRAPLATVEQMATVMRDRRGPGDAARAPGHRGLVYDPTAQLVIIDPGLMVLWVADPTAAGELRAFDLRHELEGLGERASPPPDVAAPAEPKLEQLEQAVHARRELRAARLAASRGEVTTARHSAARALARAPDLPEALELAGRLAASAGDHGAARALLQRWLDAGADDPDREAQVRSLLTTDRGW